MEKYPTRGELVIVTVESVGSQGAFVRLDEYGGKQGIVSIREFSPKWVKNPRDYLKEGQKSVLKVLRVNVERGHIDLSLKEVNENEKRNKLKEFKLEIRVGKLMTHLADLLKKKESELYTLFGNKLLEDYGSLYDGFSQVSNSKEDLKYIKDEKLRQEIIRLIREGIKPTFVSVKGFVSISSQDGDSIEKIKNALLTGEKFLGEKGTLSYVTPPYYRIDVTADDYKNAERIMRECYEVIEKQADSEGIKTEFTKEPKKAA